MAFDVKQWWQTVAKEAGVPEDQAKVISETLQNENVAKRFQNDFVDRSTFSRELDAKDKTVKETKAAAEEYYRREAEKTAKNQEVVDRAQAMVARYVQEYGELPNSGAVAAGVPGAKEALDASKFISREDHQKEIQHVQEQNLFVTIEGLKAVGDHLYRFKEPLDVDGLKKFAIERNLPINVAYQEFIKDKVAAQQDASFAEKLKAAREEGAREAMSRMKVPVDASPKEPAPFYTSLTADRSKGVSEQDRISGFAEAWHNANATKS